MQVLSRRGYSIFSSPWCLLTSFSTPLCTLLSFALASLPSQNKRVFNLSALKTHIEPACLHNYDLTPLLSLICKHAESAVYFSCLEFIPESVLGCTLQFHWRSS